MQTIRLHGSPTARQRVKTEKSAKRTRQYHPRILQGNHEARSADDRVLRRSTSSKSRNSVMSRSGRNRRRLVMLDPASTLERNIGLVYYRRLRRVIACAPPGLTSTLTPAAAMTC